MGQCVVHKVWTPPISLSTSVFHHDKDKIKDALILVGDKDKDALILVGDKLTRPDLISAHMLG